MVFQEAVKWKQMHEPDGGEAEQVFHGAFDIGHVFFFWDCVVCVADDSVVFRVGKSLIFVALKSLNLFDDREFRGYVAFTVSMTVRFGDSNSDSSETTNQMEITWLKLVTDKANSPEFNPGIDDLLEMRKISTSSDEMIEENKDDQTLSDLGSEIGLQSLAEIKDVGIDLGHFVTKAIILVKPAQAPSMEFIVASVSSDPDIAQNPDLKSSKIVYELNGEKNVQSLIRAVFELNCFPRWGSVSISGRRREMEDEISAIPNFLNIPAKLLISKNTNMGQSQNFTHLQSHFYGVYDGHGGSQVASYCREQLHLALADEIGAVEDSLIDGDTEENTEERWRGIFTDCFLRVDDRIGRIGGNGVESEPIVPETVGSTAVVALVCATHIMVANCGDSRAVLCRGKKPIPLSVDHKPNREDEFTRIEESGGKVIQWNGHRVFGVLAMSRAIGDRYLKPWIIPDPEITMTPRTREDDLLILASDGLWDVVSNEEACEAARKRIMLWHKKNESSNVVTGKGGAVVDPAAQAAADYLAGVALQRGSRDNISVIVVDLKARRKVKAKT